MSLQARKKSLRQSIIADRVLLAGEVRERADRAIAARLGQLPAFREAGTVLGYMSFGAEFATDSWLQQVLQAGKNLLLPRVNQQTRMLDLYRVTDLGSQLAVGAYGIREPLEGCPEAGLDEADLILLPGVGFDRSGARLGYGGGFYDKLLARLDDKAARPVLVAAAYELQLVDEIPQESTDRRVHWLVTEVETINCAA